MVGNIQEISKFGNIYFDSPQKVIIFNEIHF